MGVRFFSRRGKWASARGLLGEGVRVVRAGRRWLPLPLPKIRVACLLWRESLTTELKAVSVPIRIWGNGGVIAAPRAVWCCAAIRPEDVVQALDSPKSKIVSVWSHQRSATALGNEEMKLIATHN